MTVLYRINAGPLPPDHWLNDPAQGGGRLLGEVCHFIDFLTFITGELPGTVRTVSGERPGSLAEENIILTLTYPGGSTGTLAYITDGDRAVPKERIEVFSGGQAAILDDFRRLEVYRAGRKTTTRSPLRQDKGHQAIWKAFVLAIEEGGSPPVPYNQVFAIAHTTFAAQRSLRENRTISLQPMAMEPSG
jgi:predicted dehydrogenase